MRMSLRMRPDDHNDCKERDDGREMQSEQPELGDCTKQYGCWEREWRPSELKTQQTAQKDMGAKQSDWSKYILTVPCKSRAKPEIQACDDVRDIRVRRQFSAGVVAFHVWTACQSADSGHRAFGIRAQNVLSSLQIESIGSVVLRL